VSSGAQTSPLVTKLSLFDIRGTPGVAADLSHINTGARVYGGTDLADALKGAEVVVVPAGMPRKPGMTRQDLFNSNASVVRDVANAMAKSCPKAIVCIITNPVNSTVPIFAEVAKKAGFYDPRKVFGVTTLDVVRANEFVSAAANVPVNTMNVPVIGGHSGVTILPLISQATPAVTLPEDKIAALTTRIQNAGTEVVEAKAGAGSATLSMAYAALQFTTSLLRALKGEKSVVECAFVESKIMPGVNYFASRIELGTEGVGKILPLGNLSAFEKKKLEEVVPELAKNIADGEVYGRSN
jgi:malate dehydrogenase